MANVDIHVLVIEQQAIAADAQVGRHRTRGSPADTQRAAHISEVDNCASRKVGWRHAECSRETLCHDRLTFCEVRECQVACRYFVVVQVGVIVACYACAAEVEDLCAAAIDRIQRNVGLTRYYCVDDAGEVRQVHAYRSVCGVEQDLRRQGVGCQCCLRTSNRYALTD